MLTTKTSSSPQQQSNLSASLSRVADCDAPGTRLQDFPRRFEKALDASGRSRQEIADEAGTTVETLSRIANGHQDPHAGLLYRIARAARTTVGSFYGDSNALSNSDYGELQRLREWIDEKLPKIDARAEPNAVLVPSPAKKIEKVADRRRGSEIVLRARGDSMSGAGILADDTLQASPATNVESSIGKIVACRVAGSIYVKRLAVEHGNVVLLSENPRYAAITVDETMDRFEILGVITHRAGAVI